MPIVDVCSSFLEKCLHPIDAIWGSSPIQENIHARTDDHMAVAEHLEHFSPSKPVLEIPIHTRSERIVEYSLLQFLDRMDQAGHSMRLMNMENLEDCHQKMLEIQAENIQKMNEAAARAQQEQTWSLLRKIGSVILAGISMIFGISLVSTGAGSLLGGLMIASSILTLANLTFTETHVWDWVAEKMAKDNEERQKMIAVILPSVVAGVCAVIGLAGSTGAALWAGLDLSQKILVICQTSISFLEGVSSIGEGVCQFREYNSKADLIEIKQKTFNNSQDIEKYMGAIEKFMRTQTDILEHVKREIKLTIHANTKTVLQG